MATSTLLRSSNGSASIGRAALHLVRRRRDAAVGSMIFVACFAIFRVAPIRQVLDSQYSMLLSENLLRHGDFALERYHLPSSDYRLRSVGDHRYYSFPPGTSVLSLPFVAVVHLFGMSAVGEDGAYDVNGEARLDARLADTLMAAFATVVYFTARLLLAVRWSLAVTFVAAFGTQVFSTTSRSMWSDTWGIALIGVTCFLLLKSAVRGQRSNLALLATLEGLAYLVRPTSALVLVGTTAYLASTRPKDVWQFVLAVAGWLGLFVLYSWSHFHQLLPDYYAAGRLQFDAPMAAFLGNLTSPSRGLLVCVPAAVGVALLTIRYRRAIRYRPLALLASFVVAGHLVILSGFVHWWGGYCYGARLTASLVPWLVVLGVLAADAARATVASGGGRATDIVLAAVVAGLCIVSVAINGVGAFSRDAQRWNAAPEDIDQSPWRLWSWRYPQFLAPFVEPDGPFLPLPIGGLHVGGARADKYLGHGWPFGEGDYRWTEGRGGSAVRFVLAAAGQPGVVELEASPYLAAPKIPEQRVTVTLNGHDIGGAVFRERGLSRHAFTVPAGVAKQENLLVLHTPDAASPFSIEGAADRRQLGIAVRVIRWHRDPAYEGPFYLLPIDGLHPGSTEADKYLGRGWPAGEGQFRWTDGRDGSVVRFALASEGPGFLELDLRPYLAASDVTQQRLTVTMNGREVGAVALRDPELTTHTFAVPADVPQQENLLVLHTPDASSPSAIDGGPDRRQLGVAVRAIRWHREPDREGAFMPLPVGGLELGRSEADAYLARGWGAGEGELRWTEGRDGSAVRFALAAEGPGAFEIEARPYLAPPTVAQQRLIVSVNGHDVGSVVLRENEFTLHAFGVPTEALQHENLLRLRTPDATSPFVVDGTPDHRQLGVAVRAIRWGRGLGYLAHGQQ